MNYEQEPLVSKQLVEWAEEVYPDKWPDVDMSERRIWFHAGQASVAKKLRQMLDNQSTQVLP